jgi:hypothetical protein|tara:strand:- start:611 stop:820 length:210 start_codon:yes stop_codon:yes gene_type:complete
MTDIIVKAERKVNSVYKILNESTGKYCKDEFDKDNYAFTKSWADYLLHRYKKKFPNSKISIVRIIQREE